MRTSVLVSCPFSSPWLDLELPADWGVRPRPVDLGVNRLRALASRVLEVLRIVRAAQRVDVLVVSTSALELMLLMLLRPAFRTCLFVAYDPLQIGNPHLREWTRRLARRLDLALCVRRSDLIYWSAAAAREFVPFFAPVPHPGPLAAAVEHPTIYSAGDAHRDYALLVAGARNLDVDVVICTRQPVDVTDARRISVRSAVSPEDGRRQQSTAGITAVLLEDTHLPAGPLVLLDAMACGAAIVCTASDGLVDYVDDGVEALVLPVDARPADVSDRLDRLLRDPALRLRLAANAQRRLLGELASDRTLESIKRFVDRTRR